MGVLLELVAGAEDVDPDEAPEAEVWPAAVSVVGVDGRWEPVEWEDCWAFCEERLRAADCLDRAEPLADELEELELAVLAGVLALPPELEEVVPPESAELDDDGWVDCAEPEFGAWAPGAASALSWAVM